MPPSIGIRRRTVFAEAHDHHPAGASLRTSPASPPLGVHSGLVLARIEGLDQSLDQLQFQPFGRLLQAGVTVGIELAGFTTVAAFCMPGSASARTGGLG